MDARTIGAYKRTRSQERAHVATYGAAFSREKRHTRRKTEHTQTPLQCEKGGWREGEKRCASTRIAEPACSPPSCFLFAAFLLAASSSVDRQGASFSLSLSARYDAATGFVHGWNLDRSSRLYRYARGGLVGHSCGVAASLTHRKAPIK